VRANGHKKTKLHSGGEDAASTADQEALKSVDLAVRDAGRSVPIDSLRIWVPSLAASLFFAARVGYLDRARRQSDVRGLQAPQKLA
jgi:hypothetical protein